MDYKLCIIGNVFVARDGEVQECVSASHSMMLPFAPVEGTCLFTEWTTLGQEVRLEKVMWDITKQEFKATVNHTDDLDQIDEGENEEDRSTVKEWVHFLRSEFVREGWKVF